MERRYASQRSTPIEEACADSGAPTRRERKLYEANGNTFNVEIDARDLVTPLSRADEFALYSLIKRVVHQSEQGDAQFELPPFITGGSGPMIVRVVRRRASEEPLSSRATRAHAGQATDALRNAGGGDDLVAGLVLVAKHGDNLAAFKEASKCLGVQVLERMKAMTGLQASRTYMS